MRYFPDFSQLLRRRATAVAFLSGSPRHTGLQGRVLFYGLPDGVIVRTEMTGLPQSTVPCEDPVFAFHIHSGTACTGNDIDPFAAADGHYNPGNCPHPFHAGDLPPLFGANGNAFSVFLTDRFSIPEILGKTIIVHASPDDFTTQPAGNAGEKIACGVIVPVGR